MDKRWASIKLTLVLLYLGVLPLTPDVPLPVTVTFALVAFALVAAAPLFLRFAGTLSQQFFAPVQSSVVRSATPGSWQLLRPVTLGARGTVRSRAPSGLNAIHG